MRWAVGLVLLVGSLAAGAPRSSGGGPGGFVRGFDFQALRLAIGDLTETFGARYGDGPGRLARLEELRRSADEALAAGATARLTELAGELGDFRRESLLANPLLDFDKLLVVRRAGKKLGLPTNHTCNSSLPRTGYDNEIAILSPVRPEGALRTLYRPEGGGYVGEVDLHFDAGRLLFTLSDRRRWAIHEINVDGTGLRRLTRDEHDDVDCFDACYLPDLPGRGGGGRIVFASTASFHAVPCWHGRQRACNLYVMDADGRNVRQVCFDQDNDLYPSVLGNGQIIFSRWDYSGPFHIYLRPLMVMNPDGTGQRAVYGSNSWWPNALYFPRAVPGEPSQVVAIATGHHGAPRMGELVLLDLAKGWHEAEGVVQRIPGRGRPVEPIARDNLVDDSWPKFLHPYPLSGKHFLVACQPTARASWGIYLADVFDNLVLIREEPSCALLEPIPLRRTPRPPVIPDRVEPGRTDAVVYLHDVYAGPGLAGVPRGSVKRLRVLAYHFGYPGLAGPDKVGLGGPWEVMRIVGTVPVSADGSAVFRVPANTPLAVQPLDEEGKALQLMRSWFAAMPGEHLGCLGCHEQPRETPLARYAQGAARPPVDIAPWRGEARGFSFAREVQPVLDKHCAGCHRPGGEAGKILDLRPASEVKDYPGRAWSALARSRLPAEARKLTKGIARYTPAYEALIPYIRRPGVEDDVSLLVPCEYHADTSKLVQALAKGHHDVRLDAEGWDRLITWIDLNAPCHGTWGEVYPVPDGAARRRLELSRLYAGPQEDPEAIPNAPPPPVSLPVRTQAASAPRSQGLPLGGEKPPPPAPIAAPPTTTIDLGGNVKLKLVRIAAGEFVMGDPAGEADEGPAARVSIAKPFWIGVCEVTNEQYALFDPAHDSGYFAKRPRTGEDRGMPLDGPAQPVLRVSWRRAMAFGRWLSERTGASFTLPTEAQWEYACRASTAGALSYGDVETDFSPWANVADRSLIPRVRATGGLETIIRHGAAGDTPCDARFDDAAAVTTPVGRYRPNTWGLHDMHGNAAEWTRTTYRPYPWRSDDGRDTPDPAGRKTVRGGSFFDRPQRCRSAFRLSYPSWMRPFNVGFRVACEGDLPLR